MRRPLTRAQIEELAGSIRALLDGPEAGLTPIARARWEGALAALETVLGQRSTLVSEDLGLL